jgi:TonB family protein
MLLTVWTSWCGVCRTQMPEMVKLQKELGPKGLAVVAVSADDDATAPRAYLKKLEGTAGPVTFKVLHDRARRVADGLNVRGFPTNFIVGRDGEVLQVVRGGFNAQTAKTVKRMLGNALAGKPVGGWDTGAAASAEEAPRTKPRKGFKVDPTRVLVDGALDRGAVAAALEREGSELRACHEAALEARPGLKGDVLVRFVVDERGQVGKAVVEQSYVNHEPLELCLVKAISRCAFPPPKGGQATVRYPFVFTPE